jgi:hypothetical protein
VLSAALKLHAAEDGSADACVRADAVARLLGESEAVKALRASSFASFVSAVEQRQRLAQQTCLVERGEKIAGALPARLRPAFRDAWSRTDAAFAWPGLRGDVEAPASVEPGDAESCSRAVASALTSILAEQVRASVEHWCGGFVTDSQASAAARAHQVEGVAARLELRALQVGLPAAELRRFVSRAERMVSRRGTQWLVDATALQFALEDIEVLAQATHRQDPGPPTPRSASSAPSPPPVTAPKT